MTSIHALRRQRLTTATTKYLLFSSRALSTPASAARNADSSKTAAPQPHSIGPRWLTMTKRRLGRCIMFGLKPGQIQEAGEILQQIARDWRELVAGSEGYLTDATRRGLFRQSVAWGEMDTMVSHVNNVTYARYAETARVYLTRNFATHIDPDHKKEWMNIVGSTGIGLILRSIKIDYKFPMTYPDEVTVYHKLVQDPASHSHKDAFHLQAVIISEARQRPAARVSEDIVLYDYRQGKKTDMPPFILEQFRSTWQLQEKAKKFWQQRILEIEARVRTLEVESWDRDDAVEDIGSAKK